MLFRAPGLMLMNIDRPLFESVASHAQVARATLVFPFPGGPSIRMARFGRDLYLLVISRWKVCSERAFLIRSISRSKAADFVEGISGSLLDEEFLSFRLLNSFEGQTGFASKTHRVPGLHIEREQLRRGEHDDLLFARTNDQPAIGRAPAVDGDFPGQKIPAIGFGDEPVRSWLRNTSLPGNKFSTATSSPRLTTRFSLPICTSAPIP